MQMRGQRLPGRALPLPSMARSKSPHLVGVSFLLWETRMLERTLPSPRGRRGEKEKPQMEKEFGRVNKKLLSLQSRAGGV